MILLKPSFVLFPCWIRMVEMEVTCSVSTKHIIIGEILTLFCNTSEISCSHCSTQWMKGDLLLSFDNTTVDEDKYDVEQQEDGFTLEIKGTTFDDFDVEYACFNGFSSCTMSPTPSASFKYPPRQDTIEKNVSVVHRTLLFDVIFKAIHSVPVCSIYLDGDNSSSHVKEVVEKKGNLYKVMMHLSHTVKPDKCEGRLYVDCKTGIRNDIIFNDSVSFECTGDTEKAGIVIKFGALIGAVTLFVLSVAVICYLMKRRRRSLTKGTHYEKSDTTCNAKNEGTFTWKQKSNEIKQNKEVK